MYDITFEVKGEKIRRAIAARRAHDAGGWLVYLPFLSILLLPAQARLPGFSLSMPRFMTLNFSVSSLAMSSGCWELGARFSFPRNGFLSRYMGLGLVIGDEFRRFLRRLHIL